MEEKGEEEAHWRSSSSEGRVVKLRAASAAAWNLASYTSKTSTPCLLIILSHRAEQGLRENRQERGIIEGNRDQLSKVDLH